MKILLIEDDQKTAEFILRALNDAGYETEHAADGVTGLNYAMQNNFDCAIVDIMLPQMDGFAVIGRLREAGKTTPIIVLSAKNSPDDKVHGLYTGADCYPETDGNTKADSNSDTGSRLEGKNDEGFDYFYR